MLEAAGQALLTIGEPSRLLMLLLGVATGLFIGILPGLGGAVGMAILLPFIYGVDPFAALALLMGMAAVVHTADTFPSVLLGVPGSSGSQATIMDGYPLAQKGEAARALGAAFLASLLGGVFGALVLFAILPVARPLVLLLGSPELLMLTVLGLVVVGTVSGNRPVRGLIAAGLGLLIGAMGAAPASPYYRYTFDTVYLFDGLPIVAVALGLFALPELVTLLVQQRSISQVPQLTGSWLEGFRDVIREKWLALRCSAIGVIVGFIPGLGGSVVDWISYGHAVQTCPNKENFGKGDIRGVIAPESSNNAKESGTLIPTLLFGIPGSGITAILLGGFLLLGLQPGPRMLTDNLDATLVIVWSLALANVFGAIACLSLSKVVARLTLIPAARLAPFLLVIMLVGAYQSSRHWGDLLAFLGIGLLGLAMKQLNWPRPPLLIGYVLSVSFERYLWISVSRYEWSWIFHPGVLVIGVIILSLLFAAVRLKTGATMQERAEHPSDER